MSIRVPAELREAVKATARRKGLTVDAYCTRVLAAAVASEEDYSPKFLEAWEKLLAQFKRS